MPEEPDLKDPDRFFATTIRLRSEDADHLLAAAKATGVSHVVAQSFGAFNGIRRGSMRSSARRTPMDPGPADAPKNAEALGHLENVVVKAGGAALRYGSLCGPGAIDDWVKPCASGSSRWSGAAPAACRRIHPDDAASATVLALERHGASGSTSPTTSLRQPSNGCPTWPRARARSGRYRSPGG